jgi:hypothetical protein
LTSMVMQITFTATRNERFHFLPPDPPAIQCQRS